MNNRIKNVAFAMVLAVCAMTFLLCLGAAEEADATEITITLSDIDKIGDTDNPQGTYSVKVGGEASSETSFIIESGTSYSISYNVLTISADPVIVITATGATDYGFHKFTSGSGDLDSSGTFTAENAVKANFFNGVTITLSAIDDVPSPGEGKQGSYSVSIGGTELSTAPSSVVVPVDTHYYTSRNELIMESSYGEVKVEGEAEDGYGFFLWEIDSSTFYQEGTFSEAGAAKATFLKNSSSNYEVNTAKGLRDELAKGGYVRLGGDIEVNLSTKAGEAADGWNAALNLTKEAVLDLNGYIFIIKGSTSVSEVDQYIFQNKTNFVVRNSEVTPHTSGYEYGSSNCTSKNLTVHETVSGTADGGSIIMSDASISSYLYLFRSKNTNDTLLFDNIVFKGLAADYLFRQDYSTSNTSYASMINCTIDKCNLYAALLWQRSNTHIGSIAYNNVMQDTNCQLFVSGNASDGAVRSSIRACTFSGIYSTQASWGFIDTIQDSDVTDCTISNSNLGVAIYHNGSGNIKRNNVTDCILTHEFLRQWSSGPAYFEDNNFTNVSGKALFYVNGVSQETDHYTLFKNITATNCVLSTIIYGANSSEYIATMELTNNSFIRCSVSSTYIACSNGFQIIVSGSLLDLTTIQASDEILDIYIEGGQLILEAPMKTNVGVNFGKVNKTVTPLLIKTQLNDPIGKLYFGTTLSDKLTIVEIEDTEQDIESIYRMVSLADTTTWTLAIDSDNDALVASKNYPGIDKGNTSLTWIEAGHALITIPLTDSNGITGLEMMLTNQDDWSTEAGHHAEMVYDMGSEEYIAANTTLVIDWTGIGSDVYTQETLNLIIRLINSNVQSSDTADDYYTLSKKSVDPCDPDDPSTLYITSQPASASYGLGDASSALSVTLGGSQASGSLTYSWEMYTTSWNTVSSNSTYTPSTSSAGTFKYRVTVTGTGDPVTSAEATVKVVDNSITYILVDGTKIGTNDIRNPDTYSLTSQTTLYDPILPGYSGLWYYTTEDGDALISSIPAKQTGPVTVYAKYTVLTNTLTIGSLSNGSITLSGSTTGSITQSRAYTDETITVTATPASGYALETMSYTYNGSTVYITDFADNVGTFTMPGYVTTVSATFGSTAVNVWTISKNTPANGSFTGASEITKGESTNLTLTPDEGYKFGSLSITAGTGTLTKVSDTVYTIKPTSNVTVRATFVLDNKYSITYLSGAGGTITGAAEVVMGESSYVFVSPDTGKELSTITIDNGTVNRFSENVYMICASDNATVSATFKNSSPEKTDTDSLLIQMNKVIDTSDRVGFRISIGTYDGLQSPQGMCTIKCTISYTGNNGLTYKTLVFSDDPSVESDATLIEYEQQEAGKGFYMDVYPNLSGMTDAKYVSAYGYYVHQSVDSPGSSLTAVSPVIVVI